jgi:hypothetical protein
MSETTEVVPTEQVAEVVKFQKYKIYVIDNTSRMHTIRIGNGVVLISDGVEQTITHENALSFYDFFMELILGNKVFSFRNEQYAMIYKTKNLVGIQIIPEEY